MKKILGLDIGTTSIGWAIVETEEKTAHQQESETATDINNKRIGIHKDAVGVRIISQDTERFDKGLTLNDSKGSALTPTANRRKYRGSRRMKSRYKLRRDKLNRILSVLGMEPAKEYYTNVKGKRGENNDIGKAIYELRDKAIKEKISLQELGRILIHLNQWRGYSSDRFAKEDKPKFDYYVAQIINIDEANKISIYDEKNKEELKYYQVAIKIRFEEPYNKGTDESQQFVTELEGLIFKKEINFKNGDFITIKSPEFKQDKKGKTVITEYYKITLTTPDPTDWNYKYQTLNKTLSEWCETGSTVGSYFYHNFYKNQNIDRIRNNVVNREWYEKEFNTIWDFQFGNNKNCFENIDIVDVVKAAFKSYQPILNEVLKKKEAKEQLRFLIKEKIIFFQRPWQQAKNKGKCTFEKIKVKKEITIKGTGNKEIIEEHIGRTVIPRSHPLYQEFRIWQKINNVRIFLNTTTLRLDLFSEEIDFEKYIGKTIDDTKELLYHSLQNCKTKSWKNFCKDELGIKFIYDNADEAKARNKFLEHYDEESGEIVNAYFTVNFRKRKKDGSYDDIKLDGNRTKDSLRKILNDRADIWFDQIHSDKQQISNFELLWELIYDITNTDIQKVADLIKKHFELDDTLCLQLANIKFDDSGMGSLSAKAIRQMLPLMSNGENTTEKAKSKIISLINLNTSEEEKAKDYDEKLESLKSFISDKKARLKLSKFNKIGDFKYLNYWEAAAVVYGSHSTMRVEGRGKIEPVKQNSMNNPIVEKIVNETISIVNEIYKQYGFDEVRIELSRELKASMEERQQMWEAMNSNFGKNEWAKQMLRELKLDTEHSNSDLATSNKSNIDKIRIIEDVVKYQFPDEYTKKVKEYKLGEPTKSEIRRYLMWLEQNFRCPYTNQPIPLTDVFAKGKVVEIEHIIPRERYYLNSYSNKVITWREVNQEKADNGNRTAYEFIVSKRGSNDKISLSDGKTVVSLVKKEDWEAHVKTMFPRGAKRNNLLRKEIPEDPINRTLNETQYISKKLKEKLAEIVGQEKVWVTSGAVTDILRDRWHLNDIMKELLRYRFENFNTGENKEKLKLTYLTPQLNSKTGKYEDTEIFEGYSKRLDHRHHAMDAIIIACTKQNHIQYINSLNAITNANQESDEAKKGKYYRLKKEICIGDSSKKFYTPWEKEKFVKDVKARMNELLISHKNTRLLISPSKHRISKDINTIKVASIRGELHKETNYAKKKYFNQEHTDIKKLIPNLLKSKMENQNQTMVHLKSFDEIIKETVLKEKYQDLLMSLLLQYNDIVLNNRLCSEISKTILKEIETNQVLMNSKTKEPLTWLSTYSETDKSCRPNGLSMNLNDPKEIKDIADPRIKRLAQYRYNYVKEKCKEIDEINELDKREKDQQKAKIKAIPLFSNAIYEVRIKNEEHKFEWIELKDFDNDFNKIKYANNATTQLVKKKLQEVDLNELKQSYFKEPVFISKVQIPVKKVRQEAYFQDLYEITKGRFVYSLDVFMVYFFKEKNTIDGIEKRVPPKFLKFLDAVRILDAEKPIKIDYTKLIQKEKTIYEMQKGIEHELLFTLAKNDMVYLPDKILSQEQIDEIDWNNKKSILPFLFIVKDMNPSQKVVVFQQLHKADSIKISEADARSLFNNLELKEQKEEIKYGNVPMLQRCIKVFTDKLGKKVVPYWEFPQGCWDKSRAYELGLIVDYEV